MNIELKEVKIDELSSIHPFIGKNWSQIKQVNLWNSKAFLLNIDDEAYELLLLIKKIKFNYNIAYLPFSPYPINNSPLKLVYENLEKIVKKISSILDNNIFTIRLDLPFDYSLKTDGYLNYSSLKNCGFIANKESIQPEGTVFIPLKKGYDEISKDYHKSAKRKLKANKDKVIIKIWDKNEKDLETWYNVYTNTAHKKGFSARSLTYIKEILSFDNSNLFLSYIDNKLNGGIIVLFGEDVALYLIGGSLKESSLSVSYSLQDFAISLACQRGLKYYDFYGVDASLRATHLKSLTQFKTSFGGKKILRCPTLDYPIKRKVFHLFHLVESLRYFVYR